MLTKAAYVKAPFQFEVRQVDLPDPGPDEALVRITACSVCGGDLTLASVDAADWQPFGHEIAGVVEKLGGPAGSVREGDKVVLESSSFCGVCDDCRNGRVEICTKAPNFWGRKSLGFSEYMVVPNRCLVKYDGIPADHASLAEPLGVALDLLYTADIRFQDDVLVVGAGAIGLMALRLARLAGARRIYATARSGSDARIALAKQFGADEVILTDRVDAVERLKELGGVDRVMATVPPAAMTDYLRAMKFGGIMAYIGFAPAGKAGISFDANLFHVKRLQLRASFAAPALYLPRAVALMREGFMDADALISRRFRLEETGEAMRALRDDKAGAVKMVMVGG